MAMLRKWWPLVQAALLAGCMGYPTRSQEPLGRTFPMDPEVWNGVWLQAPQLGIDRPLAFSVSVVDADNGVIAVRLCEEELEWLRAQPWINMNSSARGSRWLQIRRAAPNWVFPIEVEPDAGGGFKVLPGSPYSYSSFGAQLADVWITYPIDDDRVRALVEQGALPGTIDGPRVTLGRLEPAHYKVLLSEERPVVRWQYPGVAMKLPPDIKPCGKGESAQ